MTVAAVAADVVAERARLVATLRAVGPEAPTMAGGWTARQLASHLAAQDRLGGWPAFAARRLVAATDLRLSGLYRDRRVASLAVNGPTLPWDRSLRTLSGPPPAAVLRAPVAVIALWEHVVHHEDVRRPGGVARDGQPDLAPVVAWLAAYGRRRLDRTVRIVTPDGAERSLGRGPAITIEGSLLDAVVWLSGRPCPDLASDAPAGELERLRLRLCG